MIICEVGLNHMGDDSLAIKMVEKIIHSGADAISFQLREPEFYKKNPEYLLSKSFYKTIKKHINSHGKYFGLSVCDDSYSNYVDGVTGDFYKVLSWAINDYQFVSKLFFESGTDIYLSTGMSNYAELDLLVREYRQYEKKMFLIHTQLSFNIDDVCLAVIPEMKNRYGPIVCYGHHCEDMSVLDLSTAFLPNSIFFYVKLNDRIIYPDDKHAVNLEQIDLVVSRLNMLPRAIGVPEKVQMKNQVEGVK